MAKNLMGAPKLEAVFFHPGAGVVLTNTWEAIFIFLFYFFFFWKIKGVFTNDMNKAFYAFENMKVGGVVINDIPSKRCDPMPVKQKKIIVNLDTHPHTHTMCSENIKKNGNKNAKKKKNKTPHPPPPTHPQMH